MCESHFHDRSPAVMVGNAHGLLIDRADRGECSKYAIVTRAGDYCRMQATANPTPSPFRKHKMIVPNGFVKLDIPDHAKCKFQGTAREAQPPVPAWFSVYVGDSHLVAPVKP